MKFDSIQYPRIAITGAGPGGLVLARILQVRGIAATVFEGEENSGARPQGGTLDMHVESGQLALKLAGLEDDFLALARYEDQGTRLYDKAGTLVFADSDEEGDRPEIDRSHLRQILLDSLVPDVVRWGHKLQSVSPRPDGAYDVAFANGTTETFDLVVGADGTWSRVRPLVSPEKPVYSGVTMIEFGLDDVDAQHPKLAALVGRGKIFAAADCKAIIAQRNSNSHFRCYAGLRVPEGWIGEGHINFSTPESARQGLLEQFGDWAPSLRELIVRCNDHIMPRPIYALPIGHRWENRVGITLLGDAAHVMSPFSGEGANLAMLDGADLAVALSSGAHWKEAVREYEEKMFPRAAEAALGSAQAINEAISPDGLARFLEHMQGHQALTS